MTVEDIKQTLKKVPYPGFSRDILSFGLVRKIELNDGHARIQLAVTTADPKSPGRIKASVEQAVGAMPGIREVAVDISVSAPRATPTPAVAQEVIGRIDGIRFAVAIASGKGGVGKSTFAVNIACAFERILAKRGAGNAVGIMDCDIYGPSIPLMIGLHGRATVEDDMIVPLEKFGVKVMSMGFLVDDDAPVVWRGPMIMQTIQQFTRHVRWGKIEIIVIDLPPGTGDAQLSIVQTIPLDGVIVVTTPQIAAVNVARRGAMMFEKVNVPLLGVAENMSYLETPGGGRSYIFGKGGGERIARDLDTDYLGEIPLVEEIRAGGDSGIPVVVGDPDSPAARSFTRMAENILDRLEAAARK